MYTSNRQHKSFSYLKQNLKNGAVIIHKDFSENFNCKQATEIQSTYYTTIGVTVFTVMIYYKLDRVLAHKCCAIVSDSQEHTKDALYTFNRELVKFLKAENINWQHIM